MEELVEVMQEILGELIEMNSKLDDIKGTGVYSLDDICFKIDDLDKTITLGSNY